MKLKKCTILTTFEIEEMYVFDRFVLLDGARRVGKSTIAEYFAKMEYRSYIQIDFANATQEVKDCFKDIGNLDLIFLRPQAVTNKTL